MIAGDFFRNRWIVGWRSDHSNVVKILGSGADHGRSADVDVFDQLLECHAGLRSGFFEGVEIHHDHIYRLDAMLGNGCDVRGILAPMQDAAVNFGMQRLHPAIEHFGEAGEIGNIFDGNAGIAQELSGASSGDEFDAEGG